MDFLSDNRFLHFRTLISTTSLLKLHTYLHQHILFQKNIFDIFLDQIQQIFYNEIKQNILKDVV